jgi:hypothetical protein
MPCKRVCLSIGAPFGNLEGICLPGLLDRNGQYIWAPFLDPEDINLLSLGGPSETSVKEQGSPELISDYGAQRAGL